MTFDLERARALNKQLKENIKNEFRCLCGICHSCGYDPNQMEEALAEIERLRSAALRGNQLISELMANCNSLRARAWKAEARIKELEEALVEERARMLAAQCGGDCGEPVCDMIRHASESRQQLQEEGKIANGDHINDTIKLIGADAEAKKCQ